MNKTRVFFVVDSIEDNEEIFETKEEAVNWLNGIAKKNKPRIYIAIVKNAYKEHDYIGKKELGWNYDDRSDTFEIIKLLKGGE